MDALFDNKVYVYVYVKYMYLYLLNTSVHWYGWLDISIIKIYIINIIYYLY